MSKTPWVLLGFMVLGMIALGLSVGKEAFEVPVDMVEVYWKGNDYLVLDLPDQKQTLELLHDIRSRLLELCNHMVTKFPDSEQMARMKRRIQTCEFQETSEEEDYETFTKNKGEEMVFCLRLKATGRPHNLNTLMFVALHECAHVMSKTYHHTPEFWKNFKWLLEEADDLDLYDPVDYQLMPTPYCRMTITENPMYSM